MSENTPLKPLTTSSLRVAVRDDTTRYVAEACQSAPFAHAGHEMVGAAG